MSKNIFIHIPKTGGTTINSAMEGTYWQTTPGFNYRHILPDKTSNSGDIFDPIKNDQYKEYNIFMMLRHPIDRIVSEYYFINERREYMDLIKSRPKNISAYSKSIQTQNYMVGFLKGKRMYDMVSVTEKDLEDVIQSIDKLNIHAGIFEHYSDSLQYFSQETGIKLKKEIEVKRVTLRRPKVEEIPNDIKELILDCNQFDLKLYDYCLSKFKKVSANIHGEFSFHGDKYDHVIAFAARACFFEFCMSDKTFIKQNMLFFRDLTFYLLRDKQIKDGRQFTKIWNKTFIDTFNTHFSNSELAVELNSINLSNDDPLDVTYTIGQTVDNYFNENFSKCYKLKGMSFDKNLVS